MTETTTARRKATAPKAAPRARRAKPATAAAKIASITAPIAEVSHEAVASIEKAADAGAKRARRTTTRTRRAVTGIARDARQAASGRTAGLVGAAAIGLVAGLAANLGRKVIVQAPTALAGDWLDGVKADHKLALSLFDALEKTGDRETGKRTTLLTQLAHALGKHAFMEENSLYPALREWGDKADADKLNHDHGYVKQYLYELDAMAKDSSGFLSKVSAFRADVEAHVREEEEAIFPKLHAALGDAGNAKLTAVANKEGFKLA
ncbi:hemerythrin domain-containing protein [Sphingomonas crocodyli]|uniref:Hemerythrin domain-containing protein n=1 Tax=Sphingomonas crocodyli TaxID=1979270 RepID=A0A437M5E8_9SPHN|nr:hemerythrin domain-containing protein [Sphingomonas crocodyli]RVT92806.1 hemerythrin domain-containing protein [Sphingomonas crocodyli]